MKRGAVMKRLLCAVAALLMLLAFAVSAFSVTVDGIDGDVDLDVFNGSHAEWQRWLEAGS